MCEVFERKKCYGCEGLNPNNEIEIDILKNECEKYREEMKFEKGEQMKWQ